MNEKTKNLIVRTITGVLFVAIMVSCFLRMEAMVLLFALITGMTVWEFAGLVNQVDGVEVNGFIATAAGVYLFLAVAGFCSNLTPSAVFIPYLLTIVYLFISELYVESKNAINNWAYTMLSQMYIALPLSTVNILAFHEAGGTVYFNAITPLALFIFLWTNDTGAYCTGSLIGKHKLFPRISPKKTWEGSAGGAALVLIAAFAVSVICPQAPTGELAANHLLSTVEWMGLGLVVVVFGTWGDLVESLFKRTLGVKDSGSILPGHGGMLDRFDSSLMAMPAAVVYLYTLTLFANSSAPAL